jgi:hypothetical protein
MNGEVPPDTVDVNSCGCADPIVDELGAMVIESGPFTLTETMLDVAAVLAESVTFR